MGRSGYMAISLGKLCRNAKQLYKMELIAGSNGLDNIIKWVHIVENVEVASFLHGYELVFTTGIGNVFKDEKTMLQFVKNLMRSNVSGLVINLGPYITYIPDMLIAYCNQNDFPLFFIPWETKVVEITRDFCEQIVKDESKENKLTTAFKDFIFYPNEHERLLPFLEREGFVPETNYCVITIGLLSSEQDMVKESTLAKLDFLLHKELKKLTEKHAIFHYDSKYIAIIAGVCEQQIRIFGNNMKDKIIDTYSLILGIGALQDPLLQLPNNFNRSLSIYQMCIKTEKPLLFFDDAGIYKILLSVNDKNVLTNYVSQKLGSLKKFDQDNGTDYYPFLETFIRNDASIKKTADEYYIHRNTVNYKISKINQILGCNITNLEVLVELRLCILISNM